MKKKVKVLFIHKKENQLKVLLGLRKTETDEFWWIPGGSVEGNENPYEALLRELQEELVTGPVITGVLNSFSGENTEPEIIDYTRSNAEYLIYIIPLPEEALEEKITILEEFSELKWFTYPELPANLSREFVFAEKLANL